MGCEFVGERGGMNQWTYDWKLECECSDGSLENLSGFFLVSTDNPDRPDEIWIRAVNQTIEQLNLRKKELKVVNKITYRYVTGGYM